MSLLRISLFRVVYKTTTTQKIGRWWITTLHHDSLFYNGTISRIPTLRDDSGRQDTAGWRRGRGVMLTLRAATTQHPGVAVLLLLNRLNNWTLNNSTSGWHDHKKRSSPPSAFIGGLPRAAVSKTATKTTSVEDSRLQHFGNDSLFYNGTHARRGHNTKNPPAQTGGLTKGTSCYSTIKYGNNWCALASMSPMVYSFFSIFT